MDRRTATFGVEPETVYGFRQAVRAGDIVHVSGQTARGDAGEAPSGDMATQMGVVYKKIARALEGVGATLADVVDETIYVTDIDAAIACAADVRRDAYGEFPAVASTLVQVSALARPEILVEIRCSALVLDGAPD